MKIKTGFGSHFMIDEKLPVKDRCFRFLEGLPRDLRIACLDQLRTLWTHTSTAIEGNTLTLGETSFLLNEGLTVSGKTLREHIEVYGHGATIEELYDLVEDRHPISREVLFSLHRIVMANSAVVDVYAPVGTWKVDHNGTNVMDPSGNPTYLEYSAPRDVPYLMEQWITWFNQIGERDLTEQMAARLYAHCHMAFVRIHPFADGNGRMARLVSNIPLLKQGLPPVVIAKEARQEYISLLASYELAVGVPSLANSHLLPSPELLEPFVEFCARQWRSSSLRIVQQFVDRSAARRQADTHDEGPRLG